MIARSQERKFRHDGVVKAVAADSVVKTSRVAPLQLESCERAPCRVVQMLTGVSGAQKLDGVACRTSYTKDHLLRFDVLPMAEYGAVCMQTSGYRGKQPVHNRTGGLTKNMPVRSHRTRHPSSVPTSPTRSRPPNPKTITTHLCMSKRFSSVHASRRARTVQICVASDVWSTFQPPARLPALGTRFQCWHWLTF